MPRLAAGQLKWQGIPRAATHGFSESAVRTLQYGYTVNPRLSAETRNGRKLRREMRREYAAVSSTQPRPANPTRESDTSNSAIHRP